MGARRAARAGSAALLVVQAVILREGRVLLAMRSDLRGWELPGGTPQPGESDAAALAREVRAETGLEIENPRRVGETTSAAASVRTWPGCSRAAQMGGRGTPEPGDAAPALVRRPASSPATLFPWYREPLADALAGHPEPVARREHQGAVRVLAGLLIDLRMRISDDTAL